MGGWLDEWMHRWVGGWTDRRDDEWMGRWMMRVWIVGWVTDEWMMDG